METFVATIFAFVLGMIFGYKFGVLENKTPERVKKPRYVSRGELDRRIDAILDRES